MSTKHTPGPWMVNDGEHQYDQQPGAAQLVESREGAVALMIDTDDGDQCDANARLIAAAPDLLAALRERTDTAAEMALLLANCIHQIRTDYANTGRTLPVCASAADTFLRRMNARSPHPEDAARAALARAEGK